MRDQPNPRRQVSSRAAAAALVVTAALAACSAPGATASAAPPSATSPTPEPLNATATATASGTSSAEPRPALPAGFPVMPGATSANLPDDRTLIARWTVDQVGSAAYDFYVSALPAAGFSIVGLYPAERAALIRFAAPGAAVWQVVAEQVGNGTQITVQTDRP